MNDFDNVFSERVREVFDTYREDCPAGAWESFSEKTNHKKRGFFVWSRLGWAATIALVISVSSVAVWYSQYSDKGGGSSIVKNEGQLNNQTANDGKGRELASGADVSAVDKGSSAYIEMPDTKKAIPVTEAKAMITSEGLVASEETKAISHDEGQSAGIVQEVVEMKEPVVEVIGSKPEDNHAGQKARIDIPDDFIKSHLEMNEATVEETSDVRKHTFDLGMVLSSMIAYNGGSISDRPGIGGGVLSQYNISDKIGVGSGLIVSHHQYQMAGLFLYKSDMDEALDDLSYGNSYVSESNEDYSITAIDIPLNFTFKPGAKKDKGIFVTMGVSSFVYLDERYSSQMTEVTNTPIYSNQTGEYTSVYTVESYPVEESHKAFSRFDFAKQLNLSLGYLINFDAGSLAIEPYLKLPLAPMTHKNLLIGYGGIGLVFKPHFLKSKKKD